MKAEIAFGNPFQDRRLFISAFILEAFAAIDGARGHLKCLFHIYV
jgi:hypothetical protein